MKLLKFEIYSYRSCRSTSFSLNNNLTGLIGLNGSGKSNVLNAILLLKKICDPRYRFGVNRYSDIFSDSCKVAIELEDDNEIIKLKGDIKIQTDEHNNDEIISSDMKWNFSTFRSDEWFSIPIESISLTPRGLDLNYHRFIYSSNKSKNNEPKNYVKLWEAVKDKNFNKNVVPILKKTLLFFSKIDYYSATQFSDPARCPTSIEIEDDRIRRRFHASSNHEKFFYDLYNSKIDNSAEYERYINTIDKNGIKLIDRFDFKRLPMPSNTYKVQSGGINKISNVRFLIVPIFTVSGKRLSPNQLSEGTLKTLALIYYIISNKSSLLLIEEPEVCVHRGLLDSILSLIIGESRRKQILISTHSDYVLDRLSPENILLVEYLKTKGTVVRGLKELMSRDNYSALKKYLKESGSLGEYWKDGGFGNK